LDGDTLQKIAEVAQLLPTIRLLTQEVFVADIQTLLHEIATGCTHGPQCAESLKVQFLLSSTQP
jgi:hypothetical protein